MLSFLRLLLLVVVLAVGLLVGLQNVDQRVDIHVDPFGEFLGVQLLLVIAVAYLAGLFTLAVVHVAQVIKLRSQISRQKKETRKLRDELDQLRSMSLEDPSGLLTTGSGGGSSGTAAPASPQTREPQRPRSASEEPSS